MKSENSLKESNLNLLAQTILKCQPLEMNTKVERDAFFVSRIVFYWKIKNLYLDQSEVASRGRLCAESYRVELKALPAQSLIAPRGGPLEQIHNKG